MTRPLFETYWEIGGERVYCVREAGRLVVEHGKVAKEVTAMEQAKAWELQQAQERWHAESLRRHAECVQEQQYKASPQGKAAQARRDASSCGSSRVTVIPSPHDAALSELDAYSPASTNRLKR